VQRKKTFLVVCVSILTSVVSAQSGAPAPVDKIVLARVLGPYFKAPAIPLPQAFAFRTPASPSRESLPPFRISGVGSGISGVGSDYYLYHLGFFCKKELEIEKITRLPLHFRLGSLEYCNQLEGK
jgi:hypothetical protein